MLLALTGATGFIGQHLLRELPKPIPFPVASLKAPRSLLALENLSTAIEAVLAVPGGELSSLPTRRR